MRTLDFFYRVLRNGAFYGYLHAPAKESHSIRMDESAEIKTSFSGVFDPQVTDADGNPIEADWLSDEIQPVLIVNGTEHPLGIYAPASVTPTEKNGVTSLRIEAYDRCWRVRDTSAESRQYFAAGTGYIDAVKTLLVGAGISVVLETTSTATLAEAREDWEVGTSYLEIINTLLSEINYNPLWFNASGAAVLEPATVPTAANITHMLSDEPDTPGADPVDRMLPQISRETDVYNAPNVFVCVCANPDKTANMIKTAINDNPQSPLSVTRRGRKIVKVTQLDNIASQAELQAYADRQRNMSLIGGETIRISTALLPGYGVNDVVGLRYGDLNALCILRAYSMDLKVGGTMNMTLERVVYHLE